MKKIILVALSILCFCSFAFLPLTAEALSITKGVITSANVAMRKEADVNSAVVCRLEKGAVVKITDTNVNAEWDKVTCGSQTGYVNRLYVNWDASLDDYNLDYSGTVINCSQFVNVRSVPKTGAKALGKALKGKKYAVTQKNYINGWHQIKFNDKVGYISAKYLDAEPTVPDTKLKNLSVSGGTMSPAFSPYEYGYVVHATSSKVKITVKANCGVKVKINGTSATSLAVKVPSGSMKTIRVSLNGKTAYSIYLYRNVLIWGTFNIKRGYGNLPMQGRLIRDQQPDVMGIQEVFKDQTASNKIDNLASLKTAAMSNTVFSPTINYSGGGQYGVGIMSRYKVSKVTTYALESGGYEDRLLQKAEITINKKKVSVYNTHFTYNTDKMREKQFAQVLAIMNADKNKYKILTGDFNAKDAEFEPLAKYYTVVVSSSKKYYDDTGTVINHNAIDNFIVSKNIDVIGSRIIRASLSDHFPLFAYMVLK